MAEPALMEVGAKLSIDASEQVQIKSSGHTKSVVIGRQHAIQIFHEMRAEQTNISRLEIPPERLQKVLGDSGFGIRDRAAEELYEKGAAGAATCGCGGA